MKRIGLTVIVALLLCYVTSPAQVTESKGLFLGGLNLDAGTFSGIAGVGVKAGPVWIFTYKDLDKYGEINAEAAKLFNVSSKIHFGPVAGPGVDWEAKEEANSDGDVSIDDIHSYVFGAAGAVVAWDISPKAGLWAYYKARFRLENSAKINSVTSDGHQAGIGFYFRIGK